MARSTTPRSSGSICWSARTCGARQARSAASATPGRARRLPSGGQACADEAECLATWELGARAVAAAAVLELAGLEPALGDDQAVGDAQQLRVGELDPGAGIAVVVQHLDPGGGEFGVQLVGERADTGGFL